MRHTSRKTGKHAAGKVPHKKTRRAAGPARVAEEPDPLEQARHENRQLAEQVKRLVRMESQFHSAREKMETQCRLYAELYETGRKLNSTFDLKEILSVVTQFVLYEASFQLCAVLFRCNGGDSFTPAGMDGYYEGADLQALSKLSVPADHPVVRRLTGTVSQVLCDPGCTDRELRGFGAMFGMDEFVLFPLCGEGASPACLLIAGNRAENAEYYSRVQEGSQVLVALANFVAQAGAAFRNVRLYTELQRERDGLEARVAERTKELEKTEQAAKESELQLRAVLENMVDIIYATDIDGVITYVSPTIGTWGYTPQEIIGKNVFELVHPEDVAKLAGDFKETVETGRTFPSYFRVFTKNGKEIHVEEYGKPIVADNKIAGLTGVIRDVTQRREMEEAVKDSQRRLADILQFLPDATFVVDTEGRVTAWNRAMERLTGIPAAEMVGKGDREYAIPFYGERRPVLIDLVRKPDDAVLKRYSTVRRDGEVLLAEGFAERLKSGGWFEAAAAPLRDAEGHLVGAIETYRDITERKRIEGELKESQRRLADIIEFLPDATFVVDTDGKVTAWNRAVEIMTGVKAADMLGKGNYEHAIPFYGERRPVLVDLVMKPLDEVMKRYAHLQRHGDTLEGQGHITNIGGGDLYFVGSATALRDSSGRIVGAIETVRDVTDRKRFEDELALARDAAEAANRAKSAFLAMMSHEIRTPMNAIIGMSGLLLDSPLAPQQKEFTTAIRNSGEALLTIINDILDFSKIEAGRLELESRPMDIRQCVESALDLLAYRARDKKLELGCLIEAHTPSAVLGDPTRLNQILVNLVGNAIKFTEKGEVMVRVDSRRVGDASAADGGPTCEIHFAIRDTGVGIPADRMDRLFQAFSQADSSTSRRYGGTGLGLAISKRLAEMMSGRIWVESELGKGSTFHFTIVARVTTASAAVYEVAQQPVLEGKRLLIIDDNPTNRQIVYHQVAAWGMKPVLAESGEQGLELLRRGEPVDSVVTDLHMPGMDGFEFARVLQEKLNRRALPVVLLSSSLEELAPEHAQRFRAVLLKPIRASRLYNTLMQVFGAPGTADEQAAAGKSSPFDPGMGRAHPLRILLAEDNPTNQMLAVAMLDRLGYRADVAANGKETVDAVKRQVYDVVLMDVQMPEMDGLEATREIRRCLSEELQPRIIAMTADAMAEDREACLSAGMDDYISKPVLIEKLTAALRRSVPVNPNQPVSPAPAAPVPSPAGPGVGTAPAMDPAALKRLRETLGQQADAMLPALLKSFESDGARLCQAASAALDQKNAADLRRAAHTLKSTSATFGAMALSATAREIETLAKNNVFDGVQELIRRAGKEFADARQSLTGARP